MNTQIRALWPAAVALGYRCLSFTDVVVFWIEHPEWSSVAFGCSSRLLLLSFGHWLGVLG